jgi:hypothetical protein
MWAPDFSTLSRGTRHCLKNKPKCEIVVLASTTEDGKCTVHIPVSEIRIPTSALTAGDKKIRVVWIIKEANPGDRNKYRFKSNGIEIKDNDPARDWDGKGFDGHDKRYVWRSVHAREHESDYVLNAERQDPATKKWSDCEPVDPRINNTN